MNLRLMFVHALSPLHAGTGQSVGAIDLAIARDRATSFPYLPGSSIKGSLRDRAGGANDEVMVFGPPTQKAHEHAGALIVGDANLLLLPVRSVRGTYAWATSPYLLARYARDAVEAGLSPPQVPKVESIDRGLVAGGTSLADNQNRIILEDLDFKVTAGDQANQWAEHIAKLLFPGKAGKDDPWPELLKKRFCILHDDTMVFLARHATDVVARISIENDTKTVKKGGLWYEESLPVETILVALMAAQEIPASNATATDVLRALEGYSREPLQLGGNATVGRGRCRLVLARGNN